MEKSENGRISMAYILYDTLLHLSLIVLLPYFLVRAFSSGKYLSGIQERFGLIDVGKLEGLKGEKVAWFHAVSVGETKAVMPLLKLFRERHPTVKIVFSTVTPTGGRVARKEGVSLIDSLIYFPLDLSWVSRRVIRRISPGIFITVEKEFWPNFFRILRTNSVPSVVVNGTISERSFRRYRRYPRLFKDLFSALTFCARTEEDRERAIALGTPAKRCPAAGNLKFDMSPRSLDKEEMERLSSLMGIRPGERVLVAGSTHSGEERIFLDAFKKLKEEFRPLKLILAPRHPERTNEVETNVRASGLSYVKRSAGAKGISHDVVILDTLGELFLTYGISTVAFVGGTLVDSGGHNLLEPAFFGKPVLYGPYLKSYLYMAELLEKRGGGMRVKEDTLVGALRKLLSSPDLREKMGMNAKRAVEENRGATEKTVKVIEGLMGADF
ncbi:MAG: 3-deoxy-D-manno-octulosonic acid transferase [Deltaproteobacteria bacterium]|nr:3-deoxy-D-manno-octulosonic acid transferase [Deltaproteobacteria bacterium]